MKEGRRKKAQPSAELTDARNDPAGLERSLNSLSILEALGDGITIQGTDFSILYENQVHRDLMGNHVGEYCYRAYHNRDTICDGCPLAMSFKDGKIHKAERTGTVDGREFHVEITTSVLRDTEEEIIAGLEVVRDIAERKRLSAAAKKTERILSSTLESLDGFLVVVDKDLRVVLSNWKYHDFVSEEERQGNPHCYKIFKHLDAPCDYCPPMNTFADGKPRVYEDRNPVDGNFMDVRVTPIFDDTGEVALVMEYLQDITRRKQAEEVLKLSEEKFSHSFHYSNDAIILLDSEGTVLDVNQKALNQFAYPRDEILTLTIDDLTPQDAHARSRSALNEALKKGFAQFEIEYKKKNNKTFPAEVSSSLFEVSGKKVIQKTVRDITKRKKAEEALKKAKGDLERQNEELRNLDRIKDGLIRDVSHELKTPVAKHAMQLEILKPIVRSHSLSEEETRALTVMEENVRRQGVSQRTDSS